MTNPFDRPIEEPAQYTEPDFRIVPESAEPTSTTIPAIPESTPATWKTTPTHSTRRKALGWVVLVFGILFIAVPLADWSQPLLSVGQILFGIGLTMLGGRTLWTSIPWILIAPVAVALMIIGPVISPDYVESEDALSRSTEEVYSASDVDNPRPPFSRHR